MMIITNLNDAIYVLCVFQKKATQGVKTPSRLVALVEERRRRAYAVHEMENQK